MYLCIALILEILNALKISQNDWGWPTWVSLLNIWANCSFEHLIKRDLEHALQA